MSTPFLDNLYLSTLLFQKIPQNYTDNKKRKNLTNQHFSDHAIKIFIILQKSVRFSLRINEKLATIVDSLLGEHLIRKLD